MYYENIYSRSEITTFALELKMYTRVIPRDLFNESGLLKCLGRIYICLETANLPNVELVHDDEAFDIDQNQSTGGLFVNNIQLVAHGITISLERPLNSRAAWSLYATTRDDEEISVFTESGDFTEEMLALLSK